MSMDFFAPGKGEGDGVVHGLTDAKGVPLATSVTPANASERSKLSHF